jgi:hypothetical protein
MVRLLGAVMRALLPVEADSPETPKIATISGYDNFVTAE